MRKNIIIIFSIAFILIIPNSLAILSINTNKRTLEYSSPLVKIIASDGEKNDWFGYSVDINGDYAIIGAHNDDDRGEDTGAAYIFKRTDDEWLEQAKLTASDGSPGDAFGYSVAIDGDYVIIGAALDDDYGIESGSAYIFKRNGSTWNQQSKIASSDVVKHFDLFGCSVSIDEDYAVIGARNDNLLKGAVYIFKRDGETWYQQQKLTSPLSFSTLFFMQGLVLGNEFGCSVSIDGDYVLIGAMGDDSFNGLDAGAAYVFKRNGEKWFRQTKITASKGLFFRHMDDYFGCSVSLDGDRALIGAYGEQVDGIPGGAAYVFERQGRHWIEQDRLVASDREFTEDFGYSVSLDGEYALVGDPHFLQGSINKGAAYIFKRNGDIWVEQELLVAGYVHAFGWFVSLDGGNALIGAWGDRVNDVKTGSAYLFEIP